jgi:N,N'-diacetyllegionaminate synthase
MTLIERLSDENQPLIVAEIGQNHDGSLGMCHAYIDALADAGADVIKFQTHIASAESTINEQFRVKFSYQDDTRYEYWRRMEFTEPQWMELKRHADGKGIEFLTTPFSAAAVASMSRIGVTAWKIGSGDTMSEELVESILDTGKPLIVSTGMSTWREIDSTVERLAKRRAQYALLQCTSKYPTPLSDVGLNVLFEMKERYGCRVGLSDHSGSESPSIASISRGFSLIEIHATFDRRMFGPDVHASLTIEQISRIAAFAKDLYTMDNNPVDKDQLAADLRQQKTLFARSLALKQDLPAGHLLAAADLTQKKPGDGIPWSEKELVVGRKLRHFVPKNRLLNTEDFE